MQLCYCLASDVLSSVRMKSNPFKFILLLVIAGAVTFVLFRPFAYAIAIALGITLGFVGLYYLVQGLSSLFRKFRIRNTIEGIIEDKLTSVRKQKNTLTTNLKTIKAELKDIEIQLDKKGLSTFAADKLIRLRDAFEVEEDLKAEKLEFYQLTIKKFEELLIDQEMLKKISSKRDKLKEVRNENASDDVATSKDLSTDKEIIEELDYLTLRMENTVHIDEAKDIKKELVTMYR